MKISLQSVVVTIVVAFVFKIIVTDGLINKNSKRRPAASVLTHSVKTVRS